MQYFSPKILKTRFKVKLDRKLCQTQADFVKEKGNKQRANFEKKLEQLDETYAFLPYYIYNFYKDDESDTAKLLLDQQFSEQLQTKSSPEDFNIYQEFITAKN